MSRSVSRISTEVALGKIAWHPDAVLQQVRTIDGRFATMNKKAEAAHKQMAKEAAESVQSVLRRAIADKGRSQELRPGRDDEQRLVALMVNPENRYATQDGWVVGRPQFLDGTPVAPYWRHLDEGTSMFVGRQFRGYFITGAGAWVAPGGRRTDPRLVQLQSAGDTARGSGQYATPYRRKEAVSFQLREPDGSHSFNMTEKQVNGRSVITRTNRGGTVKVGGQYGARPGNRGSSDNPISTRPEGIAKYTQFDRERIARDHDRMAAEARANPQHPNDEHRLGFPTTRGRAPLITIKNPIHPYRYFERGGEQFWESGRVEAIYRQHGVIE